ncbi:MAG: hypothetical protein R3B13_20050 [Polyangiaceae bacterium]
MPCAKCGSPHVLEPDTGDENDDCTLETSTSSVNEPADLRILGDPRATMFKEATRLPLQFSACCNCGAVEFRVPQRALGDLQRLYEKRRGRR